MVFEKIQALLADHLNLDESEIKMESNIIDDLKADSLDIVEMVMELEDEFGVSVPDEKVSTLKTVGDLVEFIESEQK